MGLEERGGMDGGAGGSVLIPIMLECSLLSVWGPFVRLWLCDKVCVCLAGEGLFCGCRREN